MRFIFSHLIVLSSWIVAPDCDNVLIKASLSASLKGGVGEGNRALPPPEI